MAGRTIDKSAGLDRLAVLQVLAGATAISFSPVLVKLTGVYPATAGFYRLAFGGLILLIIVLIKRERVRLAPRPLFWATLCGAIFALDLFVWHRTVHYIGPGLSTLIANFQVFVMAAAGLVILREPPTARQLIAIPLALFGLALIVGIDWQSLAVEYRTGIIFGLGAAVTYAAYLLCMRHSRRDSTDPVPSREIAIVSLVGAAILGAAAFAEGEALAITNRGDVTWLVCYGVLSHGVGMLFITSSLPHVTTTQAGLGLLLQPTLSFAWDVLFFARSMTVVELCGAAIALFAIYLGSRSRSEQAQRAR